MQRGPYASLKLRNLKVAGLVLGTVSIAGVISASVGAKDLRTAWSDISKSQTRAPSSFQTYFNPGEDRIWTTRMEFPNAAGKIGLVFTGSPFATKSHPFFRAGPNGRACVTCHQPADAMSVSVTTVNQRWSAHGATDPLFAAIDGSNCPNLPQEKAEAHSLLLKRGLFRIPLVWPPKQADGQPIVPEFAIKVVSDPTGCNLDPIYGINSSNPTVSVYRRPRMVGNLRYIETPLYDFNFKTMMPMAYDPVTHQRSSMSLMADARAPSLRFQAEDASMRHLEKTGSYSMEDIARIVDFERNLHVAQNASSIAGRFDVAGTPEALGVDAMVKGKIHLNGNDRNTGVFYSFDEWKKPQTNDRATAFRASVARGYDVFFLRPFMIRDTVGINNIRLGNPLKQTCGFCHNTQLTGHDDVPGWMDIGNNNSPFANQTGDLPLFKITCTPDARPHPYLGRVIYTTDPGRALISGRCRDVGGLVMQQFRGIASRAPYFNNGSAKSLREVIDFYDRRYQANFSDQEKDDLVNFLSVL